MFFARTLLELNSPKRNTSQTFISYAKLFDLTEADRHMRASEWMGDWCLTPKSNLSTISYIEIVWYCLLLFSKLNTVYLNFAVILQKHPISCKTYCSSSQKIVGLISGQNQTKEYKTGICCFSSKYEALPINSLKSG